jgi:hypothetical protein
MNVEVRIWKDFALLESRRIAKIKIWISQMNKYRLIENLELHLQSTFYM